ncbi:MAG: hypothetical protein LBQ94_02905, partial [Treponema sp.]|nr:hypothetical protein [Treponema sp.]
RGSIPLTSRKSFPSKKNNTQQEFFQNEISWGIETFLRACLGRDIAAPDRQTVMDDRLAKKAARKEQTGCLRLEGNSPHLQKISISPSTL